MAAHLTEKDRRWDREREKQLRKLVYALRSPLLLFRATDVLREQTKTFNWGPNKIREITVAQLLRENSRGREILVAASQPDGLVTLPGLSRDGIEALRAAALEPCAIVEAEPGVFDAWIRLCLPTSLAPDHMLVAARCVAAVAGASVIGAHWQAGGHAPSFWSRPDMVPASPVARLEFTGKPFAPGGRKLLRRAERILAQQLAAAAAASAAGGNPADDVEAIARPSSDTHAAALYQQYAAILSVHGEASPEAVDRTVAMAAFRAGASVDRVRQLLKSGGERSRAIEAAIEAVLRDPELVRWASTMRARMSRLVDLVDATRRTEAQAAVATKLFG